MFWGPALLVKSHVLVFSIELEIQSQRLCRLQCDPVAYGPGAAIAQQVYRSSRWETRSWPLIVCSIPCVSIHVSLLCGSPRLRWGRRSGDVSPIFDFSPAINRSQWRASTTDASRRWWKSSVVSCSWTCFLLGW